MYYNDSRGDTSLDSALTSTISSLVEVGARPWVMLQVPSYNFNVPRALAKTSIFNSDLTASLVATGGRNVLRHDSPTIIEIIELAGGRIIDPRRCFLDDAHLHLLIEKNGRSLYADDHHLSVTGATVVLLPCLNEALAHGG